MELAEARHRIGKLVEEVVMALEHGEGGAAPEGVGQMGEGVAVDPELLEALKRADGLPVKSNARVYITWMDVVTREHSRRRSQVKRVNRVGKIRRSVAHTAAKPVDCPPA